MGYSNNIIVGLCCLRKGRVKMTYGAIGKTAVFRVLRKGYKWRYLKQREIRLNG